MVQRRTKRNAGARAARSRQVYRAVAVLLAVLFAAAALHELFFVLSGHENEHDHETCPFCLLMHTPVLVGVCAVLLVRVPIGHSSPGYDIDAPVTRFVALPAGPRAPPLR